MSKPLKIETGESGRISPPGKLWVAVWRRHARPDGVEYDDIDEEMYATPDEWREIIRQISARLESP